MNPGGFTGAASQNPSNSRTSQWSRDSWVESPSDGPAHFPEHGQEPGEAFRAGSLVRVNLHSAAHVARSRVDVVSQEVCRASIRHQLVERRNHKVVGKRCETSGCAMDVEQCCLGATRNSRKICLM